MEKLIVVGAGGFAREVMWQIQSKNKLTNQYEILGYVDESTLKGTIVNSLPVLGDDNWLLQNEIEVNVVIAVGSPSLRKRIYEKLSTNQNLKFPTILAANATYSDTVTFGQGCIICEKSIFTTNISVGDFVVVNPGCIVSHDTNIGDFVTIAPGANLAGNVQVGAGSKIGLGTNIIPGKTIGENSIIGAGAVVTSDIPSNCTAVGVPARPIKCHGTEV